MGLYRRFARSKRGMGTIFGGLFFVILILMGFNLMLWVFIQQDSYNSIVAQMNQADQQSISENLVPQAPGAVNITSNGFNILVNNVGGNPVSIARIYITNLSPTGSTTCSGAAAPCTVDPSPSPGYSFKNGNIAPGTINQFLSVSSTGLNLGDGSGYKVVLASTRGRLFSFYYPWPVTTPPPGGGGGLFVTSVGPLQIYFDSKSFNFTQGSQTSSNTAFCMPSSGNVVFWIKVANTSLNSTVTLKAQTMMQMQPYSANGFGQFVRMWIDGPTTVNPSNVAGYVETGPGANPYVLQPGTFNGPGPSVIVKFSAKAQGTADSQAMGSADNWITFIGFYYTYQGQPQGQTIPFMDFRTVASYPGSC